MTRPDGLRRTADGDLVDDRDPAPRLATAPAISDHGCRRGWFGEDRDGRPVPCPTCRPHLAATRTALEPSAPPPPELQRLIDATRRKATRSAP